MTVKDILKSNYSYKVTNEVFGHSLIISNCDKNDFNIDNLNIKKSGENVKILFSYFEENNIIIVNNFQDFIEKYPSYKSLKSTNKDIFILDTKQFISSIESELITAYKDIEYLEMLIERLSIDNKKSAFNTITYEIIHQRKIYLQNKVNIDTLNKINETKLSEKIKTCYNKFVSKDELDFDTKQMFLKKAFEDIFKNKKNITFIEVIDEFNTLIQEYEIIKRAYIENLDTQKIKYDYQQKTHEINEKLSSTLNDVHTKLILLPIAFVVAIAQMNDKTLSIQMLIFIGLFMFTLLMHLFSRTQKKVLSNIESDINYWDDFYKKHLNHNYQNNLSEKITNLKTLLTLIYNRINISLVISWILVFFFLIYLCGIDNAIMLFYKL